jgi:hypothetical protein
MYRIKVSQGVPESRRCGVPTEPDVARKGIGMRVLLIEDESATAQSIYLMLKSESFNVYTTDLGEEGVLRDNLDEKAATIWMGIGGRGLTLIVAHRSHGARAKFERLFNALAGPGGPLSSIALGDLSRPVNQRVRFGF